MIPVIIVLVWILGFDVILYIEDRIHFRHLGPFSWGKFIGLLLFWPISYPMCIFAEGID